MQDTVGIAKLVRLKIKIEKLLLTDGRQKATLIPLGNVMIFSVRCGCHHAMILPTGDIELASSIGISALYHG